MIILTGAAGFIGSALLEKLNSEGRRDILLVDNLGSDDKWKNLRGKDFLDLIPIEKFGRDVTTGSEFGNVESIIHLGACSATTERNADFVIENNYRYSKNLAEWAFNRQVHFLYASSAATYGGGEHGFDDAIETLPKLVPQNVYGYSKHLFDRWIVENKALDRAVGIKFFNVFGPNEYHKGEMQSVVVKAYRQVLERGSIQLFKSYTEKFGDGDQMRDFVYVKDCVNVLWWFLNNQGQGGIFNLGTGKARTWNDLARAVFQAMNRPNKIEYIEMPVSMRDRYQNFTQANVGKLRNAGYKAPFASLEESVRDYIQSYLLRPEPFL